jgi:hypothetical protein
MGFSTTHPGILGAVLVWDSIHDHHKFQHSHAHAPFVHSLLTFLAGDITARHMELDPADKPALKQILSAPITHVSHLSIRKDKGADFIRDYDEAFKKYVIGEKYRGMWTQYSYEDPYFLR